MKAVACLVCYHDSLSSNGGVETVALLSADNNTHRHESRVTGGWSTLIQAYNVAAVEFNCG